MTFRIVAADPRTVEAALSVDIDLPAVAVLGMDGDEVVGSGGLAWGGGRCFIWFKMVRKDRRYAPAIVRATKRMLRKAVQLGETEVFTPRDPSEPMSEKLLTILGFTFAGEEQGQELWKWSPSIG